jgi:uncharacterized protein
MRKPKIWPSILACAICVGLVLSWYIGSKLTAATPSIVKPAPTLAQDISFESEPGIRITGSFWQQPKGAPAILLMHGNGGNRSNLFGTATRLHQAGYAVLAIDLRGHGGSTPAEKTFGYSEAADAHAARDWLAKRHPGSPIGIVGFSLGGASAVLGPKGPVKSDVLVLMSTYPDISSAIYNRIEHRAGGAVASVIEPLLSYQSKLRIGVWPDEISPEKALKLYENPVLIMGGSEDYHTPPSELRRMQKAAGDKASLYIVQGADHGDIQNDNSEEWYAVLIAFLDQHLKK